jgi:16S rRNA (cytidine1402-2'-O)-methyltransferase
MSEDKSVSSTTGVLYVVATPIGNLQDITHRALDVLRNVFLVAAEDTRHTARLLTHYGIKARLWSCHDHNESQITAYLLERLADGDDVALVSDAGTPLINDPGYPLVRAARARGYRVVPVPGANAAICALSAAGLPTDRFLFLGFPPRKAAKRREWLARVKEEPGTLVFYEAGSRIVDTLDDLGAVLGGDRRGVVAREVTKRFETFLEGTLGALSASVRGQPQQRLGEFVVLVQGHQAVPGSAQEAEEARVLRILAGELPLKQAVALAARITGGKKNRLYKLALGWGERSDDRGQTSRT